MYARAVTLLGERSGGVVAGRISSVMAEISAVSRESEKHFPMRTNVKLMLLLIGKYVFQGNTNLNTLR